MWDGDTCPCDTFGLNPDDLPKDGIFTVTQYASGVEVAHDRPILGGEPTTHQPKSGETP